MTKGIFRRAALEHHVRGRTDGDILRFDLRWLRWTFRIVAAAAVAAVLYIIFFDVGEYATGRAFVRVDGRRAVVAVYSGTVESVLVQPGQRVEKDAVLVTMTAQLEEAELQRATAEFDLHLAQLLRDPGNQAAKQSLASLRPRRDQARQLARARFLRAPAAGIVTDVRARVGMHIEARSVVVGLAPEGAPASIVCVLPGDYRPMLERGQDIRFALDGFRFEYRTAKVESVGEEVVGPIEMKRWLGPELADAFPIDGPSVLVKGTLSARTFTADGRTHAYVEGLTAKVDVRVRREPIILVLLPSLKALRPWRGAS